ncbi:hypothetical protein ACFLYA_01165 [Candidatus Dependentiae bacterium]
MKKQIIFLSLLLAIPSHIYAKIITVENNTGKDITIIIGNGYLEMAPEESKNVEIIVEKRKGGALRSISESESEEMLEEFGLVIPANIIWAYGKNLKGTFDAFQTTKETQKPKTKKEEEEFEYIASPKKMYPLTLNNISAITFHPDGKYEVIIEIVEEEEGEKVSIFGHYPHQQSDSIQTSIPSSYHVLHTVFGEKAAEKEISEGPDITVKNKTGEKIRIKAASEEAFSPLDKNAVTAVSTEGVQKGVGAIMWQTLSQQKYNNYYQILPHGKITSVTLKPYGKYDVTMKKIIGSKTFENQAADISIGKGIKQGIHIYNATNKKINILVKGWTKWGTLRPKEETFIETAGMKKDEPILTWVPETEEQIIKEYSISPDKKTKIESIKSIVLKPNGTYDISLKQKKNVTKTIENQKAKEKKIERKPVEIEVL